MSLLVNLILDQAADAAPDRVALTLGDDALTFGEVRRWANRLTHGLHGLGVRRHDTVAHLDDVALATAPLKFAIGRLGAAFAPVNPACGEAELRAALEYLRPRLVVCGARHRERVASIAGELGLPVAVVGEIPGAPDEPSLPLPSDDDTLTIFLTSGSTGLPKGVMVSHRATWLRNHAGSGATVTSGGTGQVVMFPLFHMAGWMFLLNAWSWHQPAHLVPHADADHLLAAIERHRAASLYCIPGVWQRLLDAPRTYDTSSLRWALIGTSRIETDLLHAIKDRFPGTGTTIGYGATEAGRALCLADADLFRKPGSVGLPVPNVRARIGDDGELLLASPTLMSGYFERPDETAAVLSDGWYHTGDLVERDAEGYFTIIGRTKEMIRTGGEWVAPTDVEAALDGYPGVAEAAVAGLPDPLWGEVVTAVLVLADGAPAPTVEDLRRYVDGRLAPFKHPRKVLVVDRLPRTSATGQVQRTLLAKLEVTS